MGIYFVLTHCFKLEEVTSSVVLAFCTIRDVLSKLKNLV